MALLCYGTARGEQLPRTYNPQRAVETAVEAYRLQNSMSEAAGLLQHVLNDTATGREVAVPRVVHQWEEPPGALVQPPLPFGGIPAPATALGLEGEEPKLTLKAVAQWAEDRFHLVREQGMLLLAPVGAASAWPQAASALEEIAGLLPRPEALAWCGVPVVSLGEAS